MLTRQGGGFKIVLMKTQELMGSRSGTLVSRSHTTGFGSSLALSAGLDLLPQIVARLDNRKELSRRFGNGLEIGQQGSTKLA